MTQENVKLEEGFTQVCVWPSTLVGKDQIEEFVKFMKDAFGVRVQYLEEVQTLPSRSETGTPIPGTGGRNDVIFAVHKDDVAVFALRRLAFGIRWIEDALAKHNSSWMLYPKRLSGYNSWDASEPDEVLQALRGGSNSIH